MNEIVVTLDEVGAAFETLLEVVGRECDADTARTVHFARVDVLAILSGEWKVTNDELRVTNEVRCSRCNQSLGDIKRSWFACPGCYEAFGDEAVEAALRPF